MTQCPVCAQKPTHASWSTWTVCPCGRFEKGPGRGAWCLWALPFRLGPDKSGVRHVRTRGGSTAMLSWGPDGGEAVRVPRGSMRARVRELVRIGPVSEVIHC